MYAGNRRYCSGMGGHMASTMDKQLLMQLSEGGQNPISVVLGYVVTRACTRHACTRHACTRHACTRHACTRHACACVHMAPDGSCVHGLPMAGSCADSRAPIEILFDMRPGDLFVLRNAGNTCEATQAWAARVHCMCMCM